MPDIPEVCSVPHMLLQPSDDPAPAPDGAGLGQGNVGREEQLVESAEVATRLESLHRMYQRLEKVGVGTGVMEAEAMQIVREKMCGPTGHMSLMLDQEKGGRREGGMDKRSWTEDEVSQAATAQSQRGPGEENEVCGY